MNSNNKTYSKFSHLSREDIETYRSTSNESVKHAIEKNALENDFETDALDGWSDKNLPLSQMKRLDKRFLSSNNIFYWVASIVSLVTIVAIVILLNKPSYSPTNKDQLVVHNITIEKSDVVTPDNIEEMVELPKKEQIAVKTIIKDFSQQQKTETVNTDVATNVDLLPTKKIEVTTPEQTIVKETLNGKEIYLKDLKLLDYRVYRSKPKITTKQMVLTGTPANIGETKSTDDEMVWKDVDVPYIDYLEKTMDVFSKGNNKKALTRFLIILDTYPDDLNANFYAGLCYFNLKEYSNAIKSFDKCIDSKFINFKEEAEWYLAKSLLADGKKEEAKKKFVEISSGNGYYSVQAKKMLASL